MITPDLRGNKFHMQHRAGWQRTFRACTNVLQTFPAATERLFGICKVQVKFNVRRQPCCTWEQGLWTSCDVDVSIRGAARIGDI